MLLILIVINDRENSVHYFQHIEYLHPSTFLLLFNVVLLIRIIRNSMYS